MSMKILRQQVKNWSLGCEGKLLWGGNGQVAREKMD